MPSGEFRRELSLESQRLGRRERGQERRPRGKAIPAQGEIRRLSKRGKGIEAGETAGAKVPG